MGCGIVCGVSAPSNNKQPIYSQTKLQQLHPRIKINQPLLPDKLYRKFSQSLRQAPLSYVLKCASSVSSDQELDPAILQKWKIILYGLDKGDQVYQKCLGLQVRDEKQFVSNEQNLTTNHSILANKSYHEVKLTTRYHECFVQIEKDLNRTFDFREQKKKAFQNVLKRVSNYFPSMGYTQGVNFVIGYLLVQGYSESDTFWLFAHLALNQRYLILGLYEDGFPLSYIYTLIFKNMLRRFDHELYNHLYINLGLDESMWIFKWFITCYIYSFPLNTIRHIWDVVIEIGSIGLVYYALSLVMQLREHLLKANDPCDVSQFWQSMKELNNFNTIVKMSNVIQKVYEFKMTKNDLDGIDELPKSFYRQYYKLFILQAKNDSEVKREANTIGLVNGKKNQDVQRQLHNWHFKLLEERIQFRQKQQQIQKNFMPELLRNEQLDMQRSIQLLQDKMIQNQSMRRSKKQLPTLMIIESQKKEISSSNIMDRNYFDSLIQDNPYKIEMKNPQLLTQKESEKRIRLAARIEYDIDEEIDELQGQSDSNNEIEASEQITSRHYQPSINIQSIDSVHIEQPSKPYNLKINTLYKFEHKKKVNKDVVPKVNHLKINAEDKRTGLSLAGQNVLCNLSITNSQYSQSSSKNTTFKPRKQKENNITRYNKNTKVRTEQNSQPSSEHEQLSIDHITDKDSLSNFTHREDPRPERPSFNKDRMTQKDLMANSQIIEQINDPHRVSKDITSEIEIFNGDGLFKKKKRMCTKFSNGTASNTGGVLRIDDLNKCLKVKAKDVGANYQEQESVESILQASKHSQFHQKRIESMMEEIESIK